MKLRFSLLIFLCWACSPSDPNPPASAPSLSLSPQSCGTCHPKELEEWQHSRHSKAYTDKVFQAEFNPRREAWCAGCHAPLFSDSTAVKDDDPLAMQGIGCMACHLQKGALVSSSEKEGSPHQTSVDPEFGAPSFCGPCHDFNFPILGEKGVLVSYTNLTMQETLRQYQAGGFEMGCLRCHENHRFGGAHEKEKLLEALSALQCVSLDSLRVGFTNKGAAHHVPSGGIDRHMVLRVWRSTAPEKLVTGRIGRLFRRIENFGKETTFDNTIAPRATLWFTVKLEALGGQQKDPINIELRYVYAPNEGTQYPDTMLSQFVFQLRVVSDELPLCKEENIQAEELKPLKLPRPKHP